MNTVVKYVRERERERNRGLLPITVDYSILFPTDDLWYVYLNLVIGYLSVI